MSSSHMIGITLLCVIDTVTESVNIRKKSDDIIIKKMLFVKNISNQKSHIPHRIGQKFVPRIKRTGNRRESWKSR